MDVERSQKTEKQLIQRAHKRLIDAFNKMKMKWQEYRKFTVKPQNYQNSTFQLKHTKQTFQADQFCAK